MPGPGDSFSWSRCRDTCGCLVVWLAVGAGLGWVAAWVVRRFNF
jgi:hypothetical protein